MPDNRLQSEGNWRSKKDEQRLRRGQKRRKGEGQKPLRRLQRLRKGAKVDLSGGVRVQRNLLRQAMYQLADKEPQEAVQEARIPELDVQPVELGEEEDQEVEGRVLDDCCTSVFLSFKIP